MNIFEKIWSARPHDESAGSIAESLGVSPLIADILSARGISDENEARRFLYSTVRDLYDPFLLEGMETTVKRIQTAIANYEQIVIYGDYDVDGITSISVLLKYFKHIGYPVQYYIPNRLEEGYGVNEDAVVKIAEEGTDLLLTVDCGITSVHEAQVAKSVGMDLIITDHHECQSDLPECYAIINPKQPSCSYPFDMLAGVGIAFKLVQGLMGDDFFEFIDEVIDIAALGTVADVAPISDENRIITKFGLERLNETESQGLKALIEVAGVEGKTINTGHIGFTLAPRINAAGRIGTPHLGVELLTTDDPAQASKIASELNVLNEKRQSIEKEILEEAQQYISEHINLAEELVIVVRGEQWHTGIIGIVASRIAEQYYRPTVILNVEDGVAKGSARSVGKFSIFDAMSSCKALFSKFGGHEQAAGVSMPMENVDDFVKQVNDYARAHLAERDLIPVLKVDGHIHGRDISYKLLDDLELLEPFGLSNPKPQFVIESLQVDKVSMIGKEKNHLKMIVHDQNRVFDSLCFGCEDKFEFVTHKDQVNMVATLDRNSFRGVETIQLMIKDMRKYDTQSPAYETLRMHYDIAAARYLIERAKNQHADCEMAVIEGIDSYSGEKADDTQLVVIESISALYDFIMQYHDQSDYRYKIHFNEIHDKTPFDILVHPVTLNQHLGVYDKVYKYDTGKTFERMDKIKNEIIPDRETLVLLYKTVMKSGGGTFDLDEFSKKNKLSPGAIYSAGIILHDLKLISFKCVEGCVECGTLAKPKEKIDIFETPLFKKMQSYKDVSFSDLKIFK